MSKGIVKLYDIYKVCKIVFRNFCGDRFTCWHIDISVGVKALESGVVPKKRTMLMGFDPWNQPLEVDMLAAWARRDVFPQPPSP